MHHRDSIFDLEGRKDGYYFVVDGFDHGPYDDRESAFSDLDFVQSIV